VKAFFCRSDSAQRACPMIAGTIRMQGGNQTNRRMCAGRFIACGRALLSSVVPTDHSKSCNDTPWINRLGVIQEGQCRVSEKSAKRPPFRRDFGNSRHARAGKASPQEPQHSGRAAGGGTDYARIMACNLNKGSALTKLSSQAVNLLISSDCATRSCEVS
jgi:hypothetical protein